ncbi:MAG TPA: signal peptidase I [Mycobacteriales bacterium]|nr:signal peptidase I [Mycobacteriales bacterium]
MLGRCALVRAVAVFVGTATLTLVLWAFVPMLWGWQPLVVTSGSMAPGIRPGDLVLIDPAPPARPGTGDIVTYRRPGASPVTHRVVGRDAAGNYRTKGDANIQADPQLIPPDRVLGRARVLVPLLGLPGLRLRAHPAVGMTLAGLVGAGAVARSSRRRQTVVAVIVLLAATASSGPASGRTGAAFTGGTTGDASAATRSKFYPLAIVAAGPVSYWRLGDSGGAGRADTMGVAPLTCSGAAAAPVGALSRDADAATRLPAATARCQAASGSLVSMTGSFTVIAWERATIWPETFHGRIVAKYGGTGQLNYMLAWDYAGTSLRALVDTSNGRYTAIRAKTADTNWHQVAMTWDGSALRLFLDGISVDGVLAPGTLSTTAAPTTIGYIDSDSMVGDVDEVAIFARAMDAAEIASLYALA